MRFVVRVARIVRGRGGVPGKGPQAKIVQRPANAKFIRRENTGRGKNLSPPARQGLSFRPSGDRAPRRIWFRARLALSLPHENPSGRFGCVRTRFGRHRYLRAAAAHHALSAAGGGLVGPLLPAALRVAAFPPQAGRLYPRFPGETGHSAACQGPLAGADVGFDAWPWAQASLLAVAAGITWHILSFATLRR